jgi:hypothetical protein
MVDVERMHFNLWLFGGSAPQNQQEVEVIFAGLPSVK